MTIEFLKVIFKAKLQIIYSLYSHVVLLYVQFVQINM